MIKTVTRRALLAGLGSGLGWAALADAPVSSLVPRPRPADFIKRTVSPVDALIAQANLSGEIGYVVADARTGLVLEARNPNVGLPPASVAKSITTAYGLAHLGAGHRFSTQVVATGPIKSGKIQGDLILVGGADPVLDTDGLAQLVKTLKAKGISGVTGAYKVYSDALPYVAEIDPDQPDHLGYNPAISGLNLNHNRVHFEWKRSGESYSVAMDARSDHFRPAVSMSRMKIVNRSLPVYTYKASSGVDNWTVAKGALGKGGSRWLPVRRPDLYAAEVFQVLARSQGIQLSKPQVAQKMPSGTVVASQSSVPLGDIARSMLKYSTNLTAEVIGLSASRKRGVSASSLSASAREMSTWVQSSLGAKSANFVDHSGLSDASRISAQDMVNALVSLGADGDLHRLLKEIPARGPDGKALKSAAYKVRAKTGTLNFVSALSGYIVAADGTPMVFAIFTADLKQRRAIKRADRERPQGAQGWSRRSRLLQHKLINRWATLYGT